MIRPPLMAYFSAASFLVPASVSLFFWKKLNVPLKILSVFFCFSVIHEIVTFVLGFMHMHNQFLSNFYQLVEFSCFIYLYFRWSQNSKLKDAMQYVGLAYLIFWLINKTYYEDATVFNDIIATVALFILLVTSIIVLRNVLQNTSIPLTDQTMFWIASGVLLYSSMTIILLTMSNTILEMGMSYFDALWHINWVSTIIANLFFTRSFWCKTF